ncbi:MAG: putative zinc-binding peptidase [Hyphomicrobiaceae bacterium]|nr:putative zinc-binding peptidase [Hyphomicrobiaceae bacterium]
MRNFSCSKCGNQLFFDNVRCVNCGLDVGFDAGELAIVALELENANQGLYRKFASKGGERYRYCANARHGACNWLTPADDSNAMCPACDLNRTIPNLTEPGSLEAWQELERAKKWLVYAVFRFGLPLDATALGKDRLTFDFVRDATTGHLDGVITIDVLEADAVERERQRQQFDEPYRTLLGHLRHESGHFFWTVLVEAAGRLDDFRALFGDERDDYAAALARHHANGPPMDWRSTFVSAYASAHPWEDWAECWAHYLHMVSTVDTAEAQGMEPRATGINFGAIWPFRASDSYREETFVELMARWVPLSIALNNLNRCMGHADFYPFVIPAAAVAKLAFVHDVIRAYRMGKGPAAR